MSSPDWVWDETYQQHRAWSPTENCWVLQSGQRLTAAGSATQQPAVPRIHHRHESQAGTPRQQPRGTTRRLSQNSTTNQTNFVAHSHGSPLGSPSSQNMQPSPLDTYSYGLLSALPGIQGRGETPSDFQQPLIQRNLNVQQPFFQSNWNVQGLQGQEHSNVQPPLVQRDLRVDPHGRLAVDSLRSQGVWADRLLMGTAGEVEQLDPSFRKQKSSFFKVGKVFRTLWAEMAGDINDGITTGTDPLYNELFAYKIRWFVVVKADRNFCTCLPIHTYGNRGLTKKGLNPAHYSIIFTGEKEPPLTRAEVEKKIKKKINHAIRVVPTKNGDTMHNLSRLNYRKVYTIEHKIKAHDFGQVHYQSEARLVSNFQYIWGIRYEDVAGEEDDDEEEETEEEESQASAAADPNDDLDDVDQQS